MSEQTSDDVSPSGAVPGPEPEAAHTPPPSPEPAEARDGAVPPGEPRLLRRSRSDRVIAGVCGGLGRYLGIDPVLLRIAFLVLAFVGGAGVVLYVIGWIAMPEEDEGAAGATPRSEEESRAGARVFVGLLFVALGVFFLFDELLPDVDFLDRRYVGPAILIAIGLGVIARSRS